jgi:hypothetical protein
VPWRLPILQSVSFALVLIGPWSVYPKDHDSMLLIAYPTILQYHDLNIELHTSAVLSVCVAFYLLFL